jgi:hypothetical protein
MELEVARIHSSASDQEYDYENDKHGGADIIVYLTNDDKYIASFFSYTNFEAIKEENRKSGANAGGLYFWYKNMVLVENFRTETVEEVVNHLLQVGDFTEVFEKL